MTIRKSVHCIFKGVSIFLTFSLVLSGCAMFTDNRVDLNSSDTTSQEQSKNRTVYLSALDEPYRTNVLDIIEEKWLPDTYYARIKVFGDGIPSAIGKCNNESTNLFNALKRFVGINNTNVFRITADVSVYGNKIYTDLPILIVARYEKTNDQPFPKCVTHFLNGNITPLFRVSGGLEIDVTYKLAYSETADISTINEMIEFATSITSAAGIQGKVVTTLAKPAAKLFARSLDDRLSNTFSSQAADQFNKTFLVSPPIGGTRIDGTKLKLGKLFSEQSLLNKMSLNVEMSYDASVVGTLFNHKIKYPDTSRGVLLTKSLIRDRNGELVVMNIGKAIREGLVNKANTGLSLRFNGAKDREQMAEFCSALENFFGEDLDLTADDRLVLKWAAVKEYSKYNTDLELRSSRCFTSIKDVGDSSEYNRLYRMDENFIFSKPLSKEDIEAMLNVFTNGITIPRNYETFFDGDKFFFVVEGDPTPELVPRNKDIGWSETGKSGIENLRILFTGGFRCYTQPRGKEGMYSNKLGVFLIIRSKFSKEHRGLSSKDGKLIVPAVLEFTNDKKRLANIEIGEIIRLRELNGFPVGWPKEYKITSCQKINMQPADRVRLESYNGEI